MQGWESWEAGLLGIHLWRLASKSTRFLFLKNSLFLRFFGGVFLSWFFVCFCFIASSCLLAEVSSLLSENINYKFNIFFVSLCIDFHFFSLPHPAPPPDGSFLQGSGDPSSSLQMRLQRADWNLRNTWVWLMASLCRDVKSFLLWVF